MTDMSKLQVAKAFKHLDPTQGLADGIAAGFSSIRYRGKQWTLNHGGSTYQFKRLDDGSPLTYIDFIILGISPGLSKAYFGDEPWTEESASAPVCASLKGDVPDPGVPIPQSKSCGMCSHNEWITKPDGGRGKECQDHKRMAVLLMPSMTKKMLTAPLLEPVFLKIPPGSLKALKKYSDALQHQGIPFAAVVTRVSFSSDRIFEMNFDVVQALTDAEAPLVLPMMENSQTKAIMGSVSEPRQIEQKPPPPERVDTGLLAAFTGTDKAPTKQRSPEPDSELTRGVESVKRRGRPAAAKAQAPIEQAAETTTPAEQVNGGAFAESDADIDAEVQKLMGDKLQKMLK